MLFSIESWSRRRGAVQFGHPELGGSGQWMAGGAIMCLLAHSFLPAPDQQQPEG